MTNLYLDHIATMSREDVEHMLATMPDSAIGSPAHLAYSARLDALNVIQWKAGDLVHIGRGEVIYRIDAVHPESKMIVMRSLNAMNRGINRHIPAGEWHRLSRATMPASVAPAAPVTERVASVPTSRSQDDILRALAIIDDLAQDACDSDGDDSELAATLNAAYHAVERFRIMPSVTAAPTIATSAGVVVAEQRRINLTPMPSHADGTCGCTDPYCQA